MLSRFSALSVVIAAAMFTAPVDAAGPIEPAPESRIVLMGNGLGSRMLHYGHFETGMHLRFPDHKLYIRNMCDEGNTPSFRPHSGRANQLGFPGAEKFHGPYSDNNTADGVGHFETEEQWLTRLKPNVIIAFFGFNESFQGGKGIANFRAELDAFVKHTLSQKYDGKAPPKLVLVSPTAYENRSAEMDVPNGKVQNQNLNAYTGVIHEVAAANRVMFVDAFSPSRRWYKASDKPLTADGALLNDAGYAKLGDLLIDQIFVGGKAPSNPNAKRVAELVRDKNWLWINDFKIPNGVHVFGRRYNPYGPANYPFEIKKIRQLTEIRDRAIWAALKGETIDIAALDEKTAPLPPVKTNFNPGNKKSGALDFLKGKAALDTIKVPEGYKIEQWATEQDFPDLANPVQMAFDNQGRLWVATMPSYPHWRPGDPRPDDKLIILEDTNNDGKADKQTTWADGLHLPMGFEIAHDGVYVSQGINLVKLSDSDNDGKADTKEIVFSGFDDHDTHHAIGAYCADPSGAIIMCEGVFLRTNVETARGPVRGTDGGFYRFDPKRRHLERHAQLRIPNPWGVAFDDWGQHFFLHTSGPTTEWMLPGTVKPRYGVATPGSSDLIESKHRVRPTSGIEFLISSHFPDEVQGDMLICNAIGFRGTKQHKVSESGTGYSTKWRQDLTTSSDGNFRPVDLEVAPDGSLFIVDWHNPLIGHMQHNARDPHRDHAHGRVYRITYKGRPLVKPAKVAGASIEQLLDNLKLHEYRTRYRTRRELRGRDADAAMNALGKWVASLDKNDPQIEHHLVEALWVTWGLNRVDDALLQRVLASDDHRARAAGVRVLRYSGHRIKNQTALLTKAAKDPHGRVKLEAITAASWLKRKDGLAVLDGAADIAPTPKEEPAGKHVAVQGGGARIHIKAPDAASKGVTSITMTLPGGERTINLSELQVHAGGKNITKTAKLAQSSEYNGGQYPVRLLVDGDKTNFSHTAFQNNPWLKIAFAKPTAIDEIKLWNRQGFYERFAGARIEFFNGKKKLATLTVPIKGGGGGGAGPFANDPWLNKPYATARAHLNNQVIVDPPEVVKAPPHLKGAAAKAFVAGAEIYSRDAHCKTCHQADGKGLDAAGFPPLANSEWVSGSEERLIKLTLHGMHGPIEVAGKKYPGLVPMTPWAGMLNDDEIAAVLTYVRNTFGNKADPVDPNSVKKVRAATGTRGFYSPEELLKMHPHD